MEGFSHASAGGTSGGSGATRCLLCRWWLISLQNYGSDNDHTGTVVIHLFDPEMRKFYALEDLWAGAQRVSLPEEIVRLQNEN